MTALAPIVETQQLQSIDPVQRATAVVQSSTTGPVTDLLRIAVEKGTPVAELKELVALHEHMERKQAQRDYSAAMARFQAECPSIKKSSTAQITTNSGSKFSYTFAELGEIAQTVNPLLAKHGLSYTWDATVDEKGANLTCVCTVRHENGHSETSRITVPTGSPSAMSNQQKVGAALTFARRLSLTSALGLTSTDDDVDGKDLGGGSSNEPITEKQADNLSARLAAVNGDLARFLKLFDVPTLADIPASRYAEALQKIEKKAAKA